MSLTTLPLGVFVSPFFPRMDPVDGRIYTSTLTDLLNTPEYQALGVDADSINPGVTDFVTDENQTIIGGGIPVYGFCMHLVIAPSTVINALDAVPDVVRIQHYNWLAAQQRQMQMQAIEAWLAGKGMTTELSDATTTREMANRIACILQPAFSGFPPHFDAAFVD